MENMHSILMSGAKRLKVEEYSLWILSCGALFCRELLHHGRRAGDEEMTEIREVSGETNLILHIETYQL